MNAPLQKLPLGAILSRPLAPSLERLRLRLCLLLMLLDGLAIVASFLLVGGAYLGEIPSEIALREAVIIAPLFLLFAFHRGFYNNNIVFSPRRQVYACALSLIVSGMIFVFISFYSKSTAEFSRIVFTFGCILSMGAILAYRVGVREWVRRRIGPSLENTMIVHAGGPEIELNHAIHIDAAEHGLSPDANNPSNLDRLGCYMQNMDRVIISCPHADRDQWAPLLRAAGAQGEFVSDALRRLGALKIRNEAGFTSVVVSARPFGLEARVLKRLMDLSLSSAALVVLMPLMAVVALLIWIEDRGPILFKQCRMGRGNRFFWIYKFRSMRTEHSDADGKRSASRDDDRTTWVGKFIRRTSIDELPQLFNVWRGDMSLVGPRPHALGSQAGEKLFWEIDGRYWNRHVLKPGVTGLAQVRGYRGATESEKDLTDRLQADLEYIESWSIWLDITILIRTAKVLMHGNAY